MAGVTSATRRVPCGNPCDFKELTQWSSPKASVWCPGIGLSQKDHVLHFLAILP